MGETSAARHKTYSNLRHHCEVRLVATDSRPKIFLASKKCSSNFAKFRIRAFCAPDHGVLKKLAGSSPNTKFQDSFGYKSIIVTATVQIACGFRAEAKSVSLVQVCLTCRELQIKMICTILEIVFKPKLKQL